MPCCILYSDFERNEVGPRGVDFQLNRVCVIPSHSICTGADAVAGDDAYSIQLEIDTARADLIPFKIRVQDAAGHRVDREYDLVIKPAQ